MGLRFEYKFKHFKCGGKFKLSIEDILVLYLSYYRDYNTLFSIGNIFEIDESDAYRWGKWCEEIVTESMLSKINSIINIENVDPKKNT